MSAHNTTDRRTIYRQAKRTLRKQLTHRWNGTRTSLEKHIRAYLLRLIREHAFALTLTHPFNNLEDALDLAGTDANILIKGDVDTTSGPKPAQTINAPLTLRAYRGTIIIGQP